MDTANGLSWAAIAITAPLGECEVQLRVLRLVSHAQVAVSRDQQYFATIPDRGGNADVLRAATCRDQPARKVYD